jgi:hypothetical protein
MYFYNYLFVVQAAELFVCIFNIHYIFVSNLDKLVEAVVVVYWKLVVG